MTKILSSTFRLSGIATLLAVLLFSSCGKDNGDSKTTEVKLNGKWALRKSIDTDYENGKLEESETENYSGNDTYVEFKDGKMISVVRYEGEEERAVLPYTISTDSKKIILSCTGGECMVESGIIEIRKLDSKNLVLYFEESDEEDGIVYKYTTELHFVKI